MMLAGREPRRSPAGPIRAGLRIVAFAAGLAIVGCAGPAHRPVEPPDRPPAAVPPDGVDHRVLPGQTAWRIARAYGIPIEHLTEANGLDDPTRIAAGDLLRIPGADRAVHVPPYPAPPVPVPAPAPGTAIPVPGLEGDALLLPVAGARTVSGFGAPRGGRRHAGVDLAGDRGDPIVAAADGTVTYAGSGMRGYGRTVVLDHGGGWSTLYAHASAIDVRVGDRVRRGDVIARVGRSGNATGSHCHFELRRDGRPVDPTAHLAGRVASRQH